jgi:hypothetical protein
VKDFNEEYETLLENYGFKSIKKVSRFFYPKNMALSPKFIACFKEEHKRLVDTGIKPEVATQRIAKALLFHSRF